MEYRPLNQERNEIRLLTILRLEDTSRNSVDPVECTLEHVSDRLEASLPESGNVIDGDSCWGDFMALSYAWGDPKDAREIYVNGHSTFVTMNLEAALRQLRVATFKREDGAERYLPFWVDALCINQRDLDERNHQVQRMRSIYTKAQLVVAWLGPAADESNKAMKFIKTASQGKGKVFQPFGAQPDSPDYLGDGIAQSIYELCWRPYWQRLWVLQEIAVRRVVVMCGKEEVLWVYFREVCQRLNHNWAQFTSLVPHYIADKRRRDRPFWFNNILKIAECQAKIMKVGFLEHIVLLVRTGRQFQTTDSRDRVYGLLGLVDPALNAALAPNYTLNVEDVYLKFAEKAIKIENRLEILRAVDARTATTLLPSWAPRLDAPLGINHIGYFHTIPIEFSSCGKMEPSAMLQPIDQSEILVNPVPAYHPIGQ